MGKKRKASRQSSGPSGPREVDPADARLHVSSYEDVADSEEEYFINKDKILLEDEPRAKRMKADKEDEIFEESDEEVLGFDDEDDEDDEEEEEDDEAQGQTAEGDEAEEDDDRGYWGASKPEYYNADAPETEADALAEEAEAKRLQKKKLSRMSEADFIFDASEWSVAADKGPDDDQIVTEVLKEVELAPDMSPEDAYRMLQASYPELDFLANELLELQPLLAKCQREAEGKPAHTLEVVKFWTLGCYVAALASYLAVLTSPARDGDRHAALNPSALRDHDVMETLVSCRQAWAKVKDLKSTSEDAREAQEELSSEAGDEDVEMLEAVSAAKKASKALKAKDTKKTKQTRQQIEKNKKLEASLAELDSLVGEQQKTKRRGGAAPKSQRQDEDNSDFGEEDALDARTAEDKAARKKSLRFYTSQIVQKADRRAGAGRESGGDVDIPHRERLRDRQIRLNKEAERRGLKSSKAGDELGEDSGGDDESLANEVRDGEDEYYDMVAHASKKKKADKAAKSEALKLAGQLDRVVEVEGVGEDGKRQVSYTILKNKGLTPKRKKEVRNPRVKKRKKFEAQQKKLKSIRAVYGGGEGRGGYQGELSGIKTGLIKSVKL